SAVLMLRPPSSCEFSTSSLDVTINSNIFIHHCDSMLTTAVDRSGIRQYCLYFQLKHVRDRRRPVKGAPVTKTARRWRRESRTLRRQIPTENGIYEAKLQQPDCRDDSRRPYIPITCSEKSTYAMSMSRLGRSA